MITRGDEKGSSSPADGEKGSSLSATEPAIFFVGRLARAREFDTRGFRLMTLADLQHPVLFKKFLDAIVGEGFPLEKDTNPLAPLNVAEVHCDHFLRSSNLLAGIVFFCCFLLFNFQENWVV